MSIKWTTYARNGEVASLHKLTPNPQSWKFSCQVYFPYAPIEWIRCTWPKATPGLQPACVLAYMCMYLPTNGWALAAEYIHVADLQQRYHQASYYQNKIKGGRNVQCLSIQSSVTPSTELACMSDASTCKQDSLNLHMIWSPATYVRPA